MKKNFKKILSLVLVCIMVCSVFSISVSAATYTITLKGGTRTLNGEKYTATLNPKLLALSGNTYTDDNGAVYTIDKENHTVTFATDDTGYVTFPEMFFVMEGHEQSAWGTSATSNGSTTYKEGRRLKVTGAKTYYPRFDTIKYTAEFLPGADGVGDVQTISNKTYGASITMPGEIFTRAGYVQIGWALTENAKEVEYQFADKTYEIKSDVQFFPVWQKVTFSVSYDKSAFSFGSICKDGEIPAAQKLTITNESNSAVTFTLPTSAVFSINATSTTIPSGSSVEVTVQPASNSTVGTYSESFTFDFGIPAINFTVTAKFAVANHLFVDYVSDGNATYTQNGTETAVCFRDGCDATDNREQEGSKKVYSVDNNTVLGLSGEYLYHKTVTFTVYGSGMDDAAGVVGKRFRPVSWYVNETINGEFAPDATDYDVSYTHKDFGANTLEIKYVEEEKNAEGEWVATGIEDVKTFKYSIGPSAQDNQEIVRPNMIVSIIFGLFGYLIDLLASGSLF
jgi:hypothetical protein